jgi:hypothetical protein
MVDNSSVEPDTAIEFLKIVLDRGMITAFQSFFEDENTSRMFSNVDIPFELLEHYVKSIGT